jgi:hypothetical protein
MLDVLSVRGDRQNSGCFVGKPKLTHYHISGGVRWC